MNPLILAIMQVESGGDWAAYNPAEDARGALQIRPCVIEDVNRIYGTHYAQKDAHDPLKAMEIFGLYTGYWCLHRKVALSDENRAKIWNGGGPKGLTKPSAAAYWAKVKAAMKAQG